MTGIRPFVCAREAKGHFDRRVMLQFRGSAIASDAGLLPYRELDDAMGVTDTGTDTLADARTGKNRAECDLGHTYSAEPMVFYR